MIVHIRNVLLFSIFINFSMCRDFYLGMFKKNDLLVAKDTLYKERVPHRYTMTKYGRAFGCPITYVRVVDRLNIGRGPRIEIIRGGLRKKYIVLRLTSPYNNPISVNIFVGCQNKYKLSPKPWTVIFPNTKKIASQTIRGTHKKRNKAIETTEHNFSNETSTPGVSEESTTVDNSIEETTTSGSISEESTTDTSIGETTITENPTDESTTVETKIETTSAFTSNDESTTVDNSIDESTNTIETTTIQSKKTRKRGSGAHENMNIKK